MLPREVVSELRDLKFPRHWEYGFNWQQNRWVEPTIEQIMSALDGPVSMARWKDGSGFSAFDADFGEDYPHRADGSSLKEALCRLWLLKNRKIDEAFMHI